MGGVCEAELSHRTKCHWPRPCVALQSLPDSPGIRSTVWKLLLGYLPPERSLWSSELKQKRSQYKHYKDELLASPSHAEADAFFCFVELLSGFRDFYCQQLDNSVVGIWSAITRLSQLVRKHDEELWRHLEITHQSKPTVLCI
ncbi:TBC1 domain family member 13-like [Brassica napus]|uniref:TBC1 domain family member 13-like n=1 Tax=Brassica napus TaxID=3708 RepID=UPI0020794D3B|nr:TBC1 domain family member 13-like [Brassica napus]